MPITFGNTSYLLIGKQSARGVKTPWLDFSDKIYQFSGGGLGLTGDFTAPEANRGTFAPVAQVLGQLGSEGSLTLPQDIRGLGLWLEALMLAAPNTTEVLATPYALRASAAFVNGTAITNFIANMQPKDHLPGLPSGQAGVNCGRLIFTFANTVRGGTNSTITIQGFDQGLVRPISETITVQPGAAIAPITSVYAYAEVTSVTLANFGTVGAVGITVDPVVYKHTFEVGNSLTNGLTIEMVKGTVPSVYQDVHVSEGTFTIGDTNEFDLTFIGGRGYPEENAENRGAAPSSTTGKTRQPGVSAPAWATVLRVDNRVFKIGEGSVSINHSLGQDENPFSREVYRPAPVQTATREVTLSTRVCYPMEDIDGTRLDILSYAYGRDVAVSMEAASMDWGALHNSVRIELPTARLTAFPDPADIAQGQINLPLEFAGYASGTTTDLRLTVINDETETQFVA